jgi:HK97 family phage prohead protease
METLPGLEVVRAIAAHGGGVMVVREAAADAATGMPIMDVRFCAFGNWYEIDSFWEGTFLERVDAGAFAKTIAESRDRIKVLFDHGFDPTIGNKVLGPIDDLREDPDAAVGVVPLFDTSYNRDLVPGLEAGVYGSSMRFIVIKDEWNEEPGTSDYNPKGLPERVIKEVRLLEFGPVTFPANPEATAGVRSTTDTYYEQLRARDPHRVEELARARATRTPTSPAAAPGTADVEGAARTTTEEPGQTHSRGLTPAQRRERLRPSLKGAAR